MRENFLICANWKMHKDPSSARDYFNIFRKLVSKKEDRRRFVFFLPALILPALHEELLGAGFRLGAQNCHFAAEGAFTGENSPALLKLMGLDFCLAGHSERRQYFLEDDELITKKVKGLLREGLTPLICAGENKAQKKEDQQFKVIARQISGALELLKGDFKGRSLYIAYEPVWAVGAKEPAPLSYIQEILKFIKERVKPAKVFLLYGGSLNKDNALKISKLPEVDGILTGRASLDPHKFFDLFKNLKGR